MSPKHIARILKPARTSRLDLATATSRIAALGRAGDAAAAREAFDEMPHRDAVAWNAMLTAYSRAGHPRAALALLACMRSLGPPPDAFSLTAALAAAADADGLAAGAAIHALAVRLGLRAPPSVGNAIVAMYAKCAHLPEAELAFREMDARNELSWCSLLHGYVIYGLFSLAHQLFDEMPIRSTVAWNILLTGYSRIGNVEQCLVLFKKMRLSGLESDDATLCVLVDVCSEMEHPFVGFLVHKLIIQKGWNASVAVNNSLLAFYGKFGFRDGALRVFKCMEARTVVSWNAMIDAHMKSGDVQGAALLFQSAPETNVISWTAMISGFARNGGSEEALVLFLRMTRKFLRPDDFTFGAVLHACATAASLGSGRMLHGCAFQSGFGSYIYVANSLVDMYSKCGDIEGAGEVFQAMVEKDLVSWNTMLFGFAINGRATKASDVYTAMLACDVRPDEVTFVGLLTACSHSGFLGKGRAFLESMERVHGFMPNADHVACVLDMHARAGHLTEAMELLDCYSNKAQRGGDIELCEALLSACCARGDASIGRKVGEELVTMEPGRDMGYVMLSNLLSSTGQWKEAEEVRKAMVEQRVKKSPGCSWIEVKGMVRVFVSGGQGLTDMADVCDVILLLNYEMRYLSLICFRYEL